jgi:uncharacterized coiled-coil protein SlyX
VTRLCSTSDAAALQPAPQCMCRYLGTPEGGRSLQGGSPSAPSFMLQNLLSLSHSPGTSVNLRAIHPSPTPGSANESKLTLDLWSGAVKLHSNHDAHRLTSLVDDETVVVRVGSLDARSGSVAMPTVEERLSHLEGRVAEQASMFTELRESIRHLEHRMDAGFQQIERRFEAIDRRFEAMDAKLTALDQSGSRQFAWLAGMMVTLLIAVVGALLAAVGTLVARS